MRIVIAECSVDYTGRLTTSLPRAVRAILLKEDFSVTVHSDDRAYKPLNWMTKPTRVEIPPVDDTGATEWVFANKKETLLLHVHAVLADHSHPLETSEPGLNKKGTERDLQAWLAKNPDRVSPGATFLAREYPTGAGPVDLLLLDPSGTRLVVEVKRVASIGGADQLARYVEAMADTEEPIEGILVAFDVRPRARALCERRNLRWIEVDKEAFLSEE